MSEQPQITIVNSGGRGGFGRVATLLFRHDVEVTDVEVESTDGVTKANLSVDLSEAACSPVELRREIREVQTEADVVVTFTYPDLDRTQRVAVLVTKEHHCLERLLAAERDGELEGEVEVVVGNHPDLEPIAERNDVPFYDIGDEDGVPDEDQLLDLLVEHEVDLVALARYMRILSPKVVYAYKNRIINVHPSLLPAFPGAKPYQQALDAGVAVSGVTTHYVTTELDQGPIITQDAFTVPPEADVGEIQERGRPLEAEELLSAVNLHLTDSVEVTVEGDRTTVDRSRSTGLLNPPRA
jgi:formyltetrahydrofolate deformylase